ncbi:unnamed protein product [Angiostrongylus costaricensis]|uniref:Prothymosin alpha-like n=1 Tax=Angiostrongylus costaricensis TaxID=334426 RepID=A0A0R3PB97_ANGCS|nr:unnamed protein product [Angiostrongylus costaricensis]
MSAVEERTAEKRPLNDKDDSNEVAVKEPRLENGKTEDEVDVIKQKATKGECLLKLHRIRRHLRRIVMTHEHLRSSRRQPVVSRHHIEAVDGEEEDDDEDVDDEEVHDESSEGEGEGSEGEGDDDEGDSGEEEDGDDAEGGEESD